MAQLQVSRSAKSWDGDIIALCGGWGRSDKHTAIRDIEFGWNSYYVQDFLGNTANVLVVNGPSGKYLRTDPNSSCYDNLNNLPDCQ